MPILEALTRLCHEPGGDKLVEILHRLAPAWLAQMPNLVTAEDPARVQGLAQGTTQQRMLREMAEALEVTAADSPLVLFIEDLHWSDPSTLDLIATVARRSEPARLMILGTYRPVEMLAGENPLRAMKEELELHRQAIELRLPLLNETDVTAYLQQRFTVSGIPRATTSPVQSGSAIDREETLARGNDKIGSAQPKQSVEAEVSFPRASGHDGSHSADSEHTNQAARGIPDSTKLAQTVYARSEGNPLFMVNLVDYLVEHGSRKTSTKSPSSVQRPVSRDSGPTPVVATKLARCSPKSMAGSPKVSIPRISRKQRSYLMNSLKNLDAARRLACSLRFARRARLRYQRPERS